MGAEKLIVSLKRKWFTWSEYHKRKMGMGKMEVFAENSQYEYKSAMKKIEVQV